MSTDIRLPCGGAPVVAHSSNGRLPSRPFSFCGEALERRVDEPGERARVVAALEHRAEAGSERGTAARELAEPGVGDLDVRERVLHVRVEAGRDDQQVGLE